MHGFHSIRKHIKKSLSNTIIYVLVGVLLSLNLQAQTFTGDVILNTQADVNAFNYSEIIGDLLLRSERGSRGITNLNPLLKLRSLSGNLSFFSLSVQRLDGLNNLTSIGGSLSMNLMDGLTSLDGLNNLTSVGGGIGISENRALTNIDGLNNLISIGGGVGIHNNDGLISIAGLNQLTSLRGGLSITDNRRLNSVTGLNHLTSIGESLEFYFDGAITSLAGLNSLTSVEGSVAIRNTALTTLADLNNLSIIGGDIIIQGNNSLTSLTGLNKITSVRGYLNIEGNLRLTSLGEINNISSVEGYLSIRNNPQLSACCILESLKAHVAGETRISNNAPGCNSLAEIDNACSTAVTPTFSISYTDGSGLQSSGNVVRPYLQLNNDGNSALSYKDLTLRYWLTIEDFDSLRTTINWAKLGDSLVHTKYVQLDQPHAGAFGYIEYSFTADADSLAAMSNSGPILSQFSKRDWTPFNQTDDYSFAPSTEYTANNHITAYFKGALAWGTEPVTTAPVQALSAFSSGRGDGATTSSIGITMQTNNLGNIAISYQDLTMRYWFTAEGSQPLLHTLDYAKMGNLGITAKFVSLPAAFPTADTYLEIGFTAADSLYPLSSTGNLLQRIRKSEWSMLNQLNDYSYRSATTLGENMHVTVYLKGALVYGTEPTTSGMMTARAGQTAGNAPQAEETEKGLHVTVLGNPVRGNTIEMLIRGAQAQRTTILLTDALGRVLREQFIGAAGAAQRVTVPINSAATQLMYIKVISGNESKTVRIVKAR